MHPLLLWCFVYPVTSHFQGQMVSLLVNAAPSWCHALSVHYRKSHIYCNHGFCHIWIELTQINSVQLLMRIHREVWGSLYSMQFWLSWESTQIWPAVSLDRHSRLLEWHYTSAHNCRFPLLASDKAMSSCHSQCIYSSEWLSSVIDC